MNNLKLQKDVILAPYTTFKIGGPAKYFFEAKSQEELIRALNWAKSNKIDYFILGGGSNILVADKGFNGLVIKLQIESYKLEDQVIIAEAGINLGKLVQISAANGLTGLEWAIGIPGTLGGAICGNAGAMGSSISEIVENIKVLIDNEKIDSWNNQQCRFSYRDSIFKQNPDLIILAAELQLKKGNKREIQEKIKEYIARRKNQPSEPSAGCVFKNIEFNNLDAKLTKNLLTKYPEIKNIIKDGKFSSGWLIEQCDLKGKIIGQAQVSSLHANFIVNLGQAKAEEVMILISLIKQRVRNKFGIQLQEEIEYVGF